MSAPRRRRVGAEIAEEGVHFRVWAPAHERVRVVLEERRSEVDLESEGDGYFSGLAAAARAGSRYRLRLDEDVEALPDPASRFQPDGPHGSSVVVDPAAFRWGDAGWSGVSLEGAVISEVHVGTFTTEGTFAAAIERLPLLADAGINIIEVMPVNEFPGRFGWGYDGVDLWAPAHIYGTPDDFRRLVDAAHGLGLGVILDVVYNHLGPDGCYLKHYSPDYFTRKYENDWGEAINFDGPGSEGVREFFSENAACWIDEYHLDGLRLDATQSMNDASPTNVIRVICDKARVAAGNRHILLIAENEPQDVRLLTEQGIDALWNDDWHHSATVALTGKREAYYSDYSGSPQEFVSMAKLGFLYQGQYYSWQKKNRGSLSAGVPPQRFVTYLQNHDQIANSTYGQRIHQIASPALVRAVTSLLLLAPQTPLLFQGQEFAASSPFLYFADHNPELAPLVTKGRHGFLAQFPSMAAAEVQERLAPPEALETFLTCKLDWSDRDRNAEAVALHRDLIAIRRSDPTIRSQGNASMHGAVIGRDALILRWLAGGVADRLLVVNLGSDLNLASVAEPLLASPAGTEWQILWSSESVTYGGSGTASAGTAQNWRMPGHSAMLLQPR